MKPYNKDTQLLLSASAKPGNFGTTVYNSLFKKMEMNAVYLARAVPQTEGLLEALTILNVAGCSVSSPLKAQVFDLVQDLDPVASRTQSVNTLTPTQTGWKGWDTDYYGARPIVESAAPDSALLLGGGAVVGSVVEALKSVGCEDIFLLGRDATKTQLKAESLGVKGETFDRFDFDRRFDLLVNATPWNPVDTPFSAWKNLRANAIFDLIVSPSETFWTRWGKEQKIQVFSGVDMCRFQLTKQFEIYFERQPDHQDVHEAVLAYLQS